MPYRTGKQYTVEKVLVLRQVHIRKYEKYFTYLVKKITITFTCAPILVLALVLELVLELVLVLVLALVLELVLVLVYLYLYLHLYLNSYLY